MKQPNPADVTQETLPLLQPNPTARATEGECIFVERWPTDWASGELRLEAISVADRATYAVGHVVIQADATGQLVIDWSMLEDLARAIGQARRELWNAYLEAKGVTGGKAR